LRFVGNFFRFAEQVLLLDRVEIFNRLSGSLNIEDQLGHGEICGGEKKGNPDRSGLPCASFKTLPLLLLLFRSLFFRSHSWFHLQSGFLFKAASSRRALRSERCPSAMKKIAMSMVLLNSSLQRNASKSFCRELSIAQPITDY